MNRAPRSQRGAGGGGRRMRGPGRNRRLIRLARKKRWLAATWTGTGGGITSASPLSPLLPLERKGGGSHRDHRR